MKKQSLDSFLKSLGASSEPTAEFTLDPRSALEKLSQFQLPEAGLWVVKMVQGAVAAKLFGIEFVFSSSPLECRMYGAQVPSAKSLFEALVHSDASSQRAQRHWLTALRSVYGQSYQRLSWVSEDHKQAEIVTIDKGHVNLSARPVQEVEVERFFLKVEYPGRWLPRSSVGLDAYKLLCDRCRFCPIPVTADSRLISRQHPANLAQAAFAVLWMDAAQDGGPSFSLMVEDLPKRRSFPVLVVSKWASEYPGLHQCSLMVWLSPNRGRQEAPQVYWLRDGALVGPVHLSTPMKGVKMTVVCPGDCAETDLGEWALRDPGTALPTVRLMECMQEIRELLRLRVAKGRASKSDTDLRTGIQYVDEVWAALGWTGQVISSAVVTTAKLVGAASRSLEGVPPDFLSAVQEFCAAGPPTLESK